MKLNQILKNSKNKKDLSVEIWDKRQTNKPSLKLENKNISLNINNDCESLHSEISENIIKKKVVKDKIMN